MTIHDMKLHEELYIRDNDIGYYVTRVPGGWLYTTDTHGTTTTFVPYSDEFTKKRGSDER